MEKKTIKKQVSQLKKGDKLVTGTVTHAPYTDTKTPSGKMKLGVDNVLKMWNKNTEVAVYVENTFPTKPFEQWTVADFEAALKNNSNEKQ